jgi:hypothetical protein
LARRPRYLRRDGQNWGWVGELSTDSRRHVGKITAMLLSQGPQWVHRRVETLTLIDESVMRRHVSVDFTLPKWVTTKIRTPEEEEVFLVPIGILERAAAAMNIDVRDENGTALSLLTRRGSALLSGATLAEMALQALRRRKVRRPVHAEIVAAIAFATTIYNVDDVWPYVESLISPASEAWSKLSADSTLQREILRNDREFCDFLGLFATGSLAYVPLCDAAGRNRVLKMTCNEESRYSPDRLSLLAWSPSVLIAPVPLVGLAESYHVQITLPANVEFTEAGLTARRPSDLLRAAVGGSASETTEAYRRFRGGAVRAVHLYEPRSHQVATGWTWFAMRAQRRGLLFGAWMASLLITAMLSFFGVVTDSVVRQPSSASSLLLLAPGLVAAYLLRPGEHAMARKLLRAPRFFLIMSTAMTFAAAAVLVALYPETPKAGEVPKASSDLEWSLRGLAIAAVVWLACLTVSFILPRRRKTDRRQPHVAPNRASAPDAGGNIQQDRRFPRLQKLATTVRHLDWRQSPR